jgi:hypothetical protein
VCVGDHKGENKCVCVCVCVLGGQIPVKGERWKEIWGVGRAKALGKGDWVEGRSVWRRRGGAGAGGRAKTEA